MIEQQQQQQIQPGSLDCPMWKAQTEAFEAYAELLHEFLGADGDRRGELDGHMQAAKAAYETAVRDRVTAWQATGWTTLGQRTVGTIIGSEEPGESGEA